jgi:hypothetical protein
LTSSLDRELITALMANFDQVFASGTTRKRNTSSTVR